MSYIWVYGPAALFGLLAAIWACTEYTAKIASPWIRPQTPRADKDRQIPLLLDYITMLSLFVPSKAFFSRDYVVAAGVLISHAFTILIITAPSLFKLTPVDLYRPVTATSQFASDSSRLSEVGLIPLYTSIGIRRHKLPYPNGTSDQLVYQTIAQPTESVSVLRATITGLSVDIECHEATLQSFDLRRVGNVKEGHHFDRFYPEMNISTADCYMTVSVSKPLDTNDWTDSTTQARFSSGSCIGTSSHIESRRLLFWTGELDYVYNDSYNLTGWHLLQSTQILCKPSYNLGDYELFQVMGSVPELSPARDPQLRSLDYLQAWDFAQAMLDAYSEDAFPKIKSAVIEDLGPLYFTDIDAGSLAILAFSNNSFPKYFFNASSLASSLRSYYHFHSVILGQRALMEPVVSKIPGNMQVRTIRLIMQSLACHLVVGICLLIVLILATTVQFLPRQVSLAGDPGTILGVAELTKQIAKSFPRELSDNDTKITEKLIDNLSFWQGTSNTAVNQLLEDHVTFTRCLHSNGQFPSDSTEHSPRLYQPLVLRTTSRSFVCFILVAIIFTLETLLYKSTKGQGIGEVSKSAYTHYLWTALPATVLSLIGTMVSSIDLESRIIAPYYALSCGPTTMSIALNQRLLGILSPQALYRQWSASNYGGLMATGAGIIASFLSVAAGTLFYESSTFTMASQLQLVGSFSSKLWYSDSILDLEALLDLKSMFILENNLSYPAFTYEGLTIPNLTWSDKESSRWLNTSTLVTKVVVPALESGLDCYLYNQSEITGEIRLTDPDRIVESESLPWARILVNVTGQYCTNRIFPDTVLDSPATFTFYINETTSSGGVFATAISSTSGIDINYSCPNQLFYVWGGFSSDSPSIVSASAAVCRPSISAVNVEAMFSGLELTIRESQPPRRTGSFTRGVLPANDTVYGYTWASTLYENFGSLPPQNGSILDGFFYAVTRSRYAIPLSTLADSTRATDVIDAIIFHHNVVITQLLSTNTRIEAKQPNAKYYKDPGVFERTGQASLNDTLPATIIGNPNNLPARVMQNKTATRVVQALLGMILILSNLSWYFGPRRGVLPRSPTNVASVLAMPVDGNLFTLCEAQSAEGNPMSFSELTEKVGDMRLFRLGSSTGDGYARRFGIFAVDGNVLLDARTLKLKPLESHTESH
ncbi:hypothetical protein NPX13_g1624 [Xylaria arbuscula]|uniref:Uncharacterized protein n=1 Tax=Xylaria arbuscula TaxID=114810 RepID=A0A9W8NLM4_9PEZI|nr:hypothetical protein NPX13_g1624 [Xylaria arbuscula]